MINIILNYCAVHMILSNKVAWHLGGGFVCL